MITRNTIHFFKADEVPRSVHGGGRLATFTIALEAWRRGLKVSLLDGYPFHYEISDGETTVEFDRGMPLETTREAFRIANNKYKTLDMLKASNVSVPNFRLVDNHFTSEQGMLDLASEIGFPLVIKPLSSSRGKGVFTNIKNNEKLLSHYKHIIDDLGYSKVIIESHFEGEDYRVQVVGDKVAAVTWRKPASVTGDGERTISELISEKNERRRKNPALSRDALKADIEVDSYLEAQGFTYDSIPLQDEHVRLRGKANISTGGELIDVTEWLPSEIGETAVRAVASIPGLEAAGVDVLIKGKEGQTGYSHVVIELNPRAHLGGHMFPSEGPGHNAAGAFIDRYFPATSPQQVENNKRVSIRINELLGPLRQGSAERVVVAPAATQGYPRRERLEFPSTKNLSLIERRRIAREARRLEVSGQLARGETVTKLTVAGGDLEVRTLVKYVSKTLGVDPASRTHWSGVVWHGFKVDESVSSGV